MKKYLIILLLLVSTVTFSQTRFQPGLKGGLNISEVRGISGDKKADFYLGAFVALNLGKFYTLQPEISYSNQGGENIYKRVKVYRDDRAGYDEVRAQEDLGLEYLSLAIANKFYMTPNRNLHFLIAPSFDILVGQNIKNSIVARNGYQYNDNSDDITDIDLTLAFGLGYEFSFGLGIEARFKQGVVDVLDNNLLFFSDESAKNRVLQIGVTYKFLTKSSLK